MPNRLAQAPSLYLRKHAENPIDWWPWCDEALAQAQQDHKPIFLSIGYSSCHWCTVMEGEAFSDLAIARYLNTYYLPIKVDREERPDLDSIYMQALQMMTGQGGWPLNIFLTPGDLVPFYGGTYFPQEPRYGRPSFLQVLQALRDHFDKAQDQLHQVKEQILTNLQESTLLHPVPTLPPHLLRQGLQANTDLVAAKGLGPNFPMVPYATAALHYQRFWGEDPPSSGDDQPSHQGNRPLESPRSIGQRRGLDLALGGICDHVGGGFHRYTVDATWTVPHFEKMLYDNGQIVEYLAQLWGLGYRDGALERAIAGVVGWLQREMMAPQGYFYAAQDADSFGSPQEKEPEEGAFYVWSYPALEERLDFDQLEEMARYFTITASGNFEGTNVLQRHQGGPLPPTLETSLHLLFEGRYGTKPPVPFPPARNNHEAKTYPWPGRIPPVTDTKMIVAWNSLMISGLARAATVFPWPEVLAIAQGAATFILHQQWQGGRLQRLNYDGQPAVPAQAEDYALLIKALIDLHQASLALPLPDHPPSHWLGAAQQVQAELDQGFWDTQGAGYWNTAQENAQDLLIRERGYGDNATPSANGVAIANLVRLSLLTENLQYLDRAEQILLAFGQTMETRPRTCPSLLVGLDWYHNHTLVKTTAPILAQLTRHTWPTVVWDLATELPEGSVGLVCQGLQCLEPAHTIDQLRSQLIESQTRHP